MRNRPAEQLTLDLGALAPDPAPAAPSRMRTPIEPPYPAWACPRPLGRLHPLAALAEPYPRGSWPWPRCGRCGSPLDWCDRAHRVQHCPPCGEAWRRERLTILGADGNPAPPDPPVAGWLPGWPALCDHWGRPTGEDGCHTCGAVYSE